MSPIEGVQDQDSQPTTQSKDLEQGLPPQLHAGRVGYGPNYNPDPTIGEKISGLKKELKGKIKHDPELVKHGHDIRSGEEKRKKMAGEDEPNPFQSGEDDHSKSEDSGSASGGHNHEKGTEP